MTEIFHPRDVDDVVDAVSWAVDHKTPLELVGSGSKRTIGRPVTASHVLDFSNLSGVTLYEPEELVMSARAGTPLKEITALLAENDQELAFEPPSYNALLGAGEEEQTLGGIISANLSGSRRLKSGAARDHILGVSAVSGRGEFFKSGGRVVKNVTGYDLCKAVTGSWGTLAAMTDITVKVLPAAEKGMTIVFDKLSLADACDLMTKALIGPFDVSGAAYLCEMHYAKLQLSDLKGPGAVLLRLEGFEPSVQYRSEQLKGLGKKGAAAFPLTGTPDDLWSKIGSAFPFVGSDNPVWRISVAPTCAPQLVTTLSETMAFDFYLDWGGGLIWLQTNGELADGGGADVRKLIGENGGGHATLIRGSDVLRSNVDTFHRQPGPLAALSARLKSQFDPMGILNPRRMSAEW